MQFKKIYSEPLSSLDKGESLGCQITSPFNKKGGCFCKAIFFFQKQPSLLLNREVIWQASDSSLIKELQVSTFGLLLEYFCQRGIKV